MPVVISFLIYVIIYSIKLDYERVKIMNIELRFLQKAINDKNFVAFKYENRNIKKAKALKLEKKDSKEILYSDTGTFEFDKIKQLKILKDRF